MKKLKSWLKQKSKPDKKEVRKESPALRSYYVAYELFELVGKDEAIARIWHLENGETKRLAVVPDYLVMKLLNDIHNVAHSGITKMIAYIKDKYYFWGSSAEIENFVKSCFSCQVKKNKNNRAPLGQNFASFPMEIVNIDIFINTCFGVI